VDTVRPPRHTVISQPLCGWPAWVEQTILELRNKVKLEVFTAVTMKNVAFWDIKTQFVPHRRHTTSPLQSPAG
jgi:hypothetical protein